MSLRQPGWAPQRWVWACLAVAVACAIGFLPSRAEASGRGFDKAELAEETRDHYERAMRAFQAGDYETAVDELRTVYSLRPAPIILYNIALAEWRTGDLDAAVAAALRAREEGLPDRAEAKNEGRIAAFRRMRKTREAAEAAAARAEVTAAETESGTSAASASKAGSSLQWVGIGVGAVGVGALGGALYVDRRLAERTAPYKRAAERGDVEAFYRYRREELGEVEHLQRVGRVLFWSGAAATVAGGTLLILDAASAGGREREAGNRPSVSIGPGPSGWAARLSIAF